MRELTEHEISFVVGGGALDRDTGYSKGQTSSNSKSSSATGKGIGKGADGGSIMDHTYEASRLPSNNPKDNLLSYIGQAIKSAFKGGGTPDFGAYNAMGDYTGGSGDGNGPNQGGNRWWRQRSIPVPLA
ncbi:hypothetical protein [Phyllobacterium sp.]|uniref:hypothetical protein n=1 Tax=unclassified Phyllobacterium TaxID=2638441 RepID=UPI001ACE08EB|nr:hypothetical protein [Phyllobacterium sp.]MBQ9351062.1 hypothetical protein [Phyllobacterium sp.]